MKRRLIQIGKSTLLLSVPRDWVKSNNLAKGDEVELNTDQDKLSVVCNSRVTKQRLGLDISGYKGMLPRLIYGLYRAGYDELELNSQDPSQIDKVKAIIWKEAVGYEIMEQKGDKCTIVNITGKFDDFDHLLRRLFLVTLTLADEAAAGLGKGGSSMEHVVYLEEENNRLATMLIRAVNKYGSFGFKKLGPLYYIIQELERIGDQYKYIAQNFIGRESQSAKLVTTAILSQAGQLLRSVYELFYNFHTENIEAVKSRRDAAVSALLKARKKPLSWDDRLVVEHALCISGRAFDMVNSIIILRVEQGT